MTRIAKYKKDKPLTSFLRTPQGRARVRAVHHLAGGNPRVYTIFAQFLNRASMEKLVEPFMRAMDDLTPYYQARMSLLSPQQRKIIELLCDRRGAVTVKEIAQRCFITHQTTSGQLKQLREMRYVNATAIGRESYYELNEPLMRICLEVKKHRGETLRLFVEFLRCWYTRPELEGLLELNPLEAKIESQYTQQALRLSKDDSDDPRISSCNKDLERYKDAGEYEKALKVLDELDALEGVTYENLLERGGVFAEQKKHEKALSIYKQAIAIDVSRYFAWLSVGFSHLNLAQYEEGLQAYDKVIALGSEIPAVWGLRGACLYKLGRHEEAVQSFSQLVEKDPKDKYVWDIMGKSLHELLRFSEAAKAFGKAYKLNNANHDALFHQYMALISAKEIQRALDLGNKHESILSQNKLYFWMKAVALSFLGLDAEALPCWQQAIDNEVNSSSIYLGKAGSLIALRRWDDADAALEGALTNCPDSKPPQEIGSTHVLAKLFTAKQDTDFWQQGVQLLITRFAEHKVLSSLAAGLAQSVVQIMQKTVSDVTAKTWRDVWVKSATGYPEMELALRLLDTAIKYRTDKDQRVLMELPIEERKIFEEIIEEAGSERK